MLYADEQYGRYLYGADTAIEITPEESEEYYADLKHYAPQFIQDMDEYDETYDSAGYEVGLLKHYEDDLQDQYSLDSVTWGISKWEKLYGITPSGTALSEQRKQAVRNRIHGAKTFTPSLVESIAQDTTGVEAVVQEDTANYMFTVFFIGAYGTPPNVRVFREWLEMMKPAHLEALIQYRYLIWSELLPHKWSELKKYTWDSLKLWEQRKSVTWDGVTAADFTWRSLKKRSSWKNIKNIEEAKQ